MNINGQSSINNKSCRPGFKILDGETTCSRDVCDHPVDDPRAMFCNDVLEIPDNDNDDGAKPEEPKEPNEPKEKPKDQNEPDKSCKVVEDCYKKKGWSCSEDVACKCIQNKCEAKTTDNCQNDNVCPLKINIATNLSFH